MPLFEYSKSEWERTGEINKHGFKVAKRISIFNGLIPTNEFYKNMKFKKSQKGFKCIVCDKQKVKGTRYIGGSYDCICYNCVSEWVKNSNETLSNIKEIMEKLKEEVKENKGKWDKEVIVNSLG